MVADVRIDEVIEVLDELVAFPTVAETSNLDLVDHVQQRLEDAGGVCRRVFDDSGDKANLVVRFGPGREGGLVLSAHLDVVPVEGQPWTSDPFRLRRDGARLFGRGTSDMKGFVAIAVALADEIEVSRLRRPLFLALSYDEEVGCVGAIDLVPDLLAHEPAPTAVVVGEPTGMRIATAHKGLRGYVTTVTGKDGHSSQPQRAANAIVAAARLVTYLDEIAADLREDGRTERFDPPYTTVNVGLIDGGQALNIVARECRFQWEYRPVPADDDEAIRQRFEDHAREEVLPGLRASAPDAAITTEVHAQVPALSAEEAGEAEALVRQVLGTQEPATTVPFGTDGGRFQQAGLSTVVCGPGHIEQAHQPDEFIHVDQLRAGLDFVRGLVHTQGGVS